MKQEINDAIEELVSLRDTVATNASRIRQLENPPTFKVGDHVKFMLIDYDGKITDSNPGQIVDIPEWNPGYSYGEDTYWKYPIFSDNKLRKVHDFRITLIKG